MELVEKCLGFYGVFFPTLFVQPVRNCPEQLEQDVQDAVSVRQESESNLFHIQNRANNSV